MADDDAAREFLELYRGFVPLSTPTDEERQAIFDAMEKMVRDHDRNEDMPVVVIGAGGGMLHLLGADFAIHDFGTRRGRGDWTLPGGFLDQAVYKAPTSQREIGELMDGYKPVFIDGELIGDIEPDADAPVKKKRDYLKFNPTPKSVRRDNQTARGLRKRRNRR